MVSRIENADEESLVRRGDGEFAEFLGADRRNHPTIIKVHDSRTELVPWLSTTCTYGAQHDFIILTHGLDAVVPRAYVRVQVLYDRRSKSSDASGDDGIPSLVYISREKSPRHHHHFKAGAMNVLVRARQCSIGVSAGPVW